MFDDRILILDFGSQYTMLIARRIRAGHVYSEIFPFNASIEKIREFNPQGIILSGSPSSVNELNPPIPNPELFDLKIPVLGICYGMQLIAFINSAKVQPSKLKEYGKAELIIDKKTELLKGIPQNSIVWMSHGDALTALPAGFEIIAHTKNSPFAAMADEKRKIYALQFHPEVAHTQNGSLILKNFVLNICGCSPSWKISSFIDYSVKKIQDQVKSDNVICALSGGVDSSIAALLVHKAVGNSLTCIFVDNGLLRLGEREKIVDAFERHLNIHLIVVDAVDRFLNILSGISDPEQKRKIIGREFIEVFEEEALKIPNVIFLAQGTIYPDVIESISVKGPSATIKSHHNVGGLPEIMKLKLVEPLRELFKDEVREVGVELGLSDEIVYRQPFPGPGLAIRCLGEITEERLNILRRSDAIVLEEVKKRTGLYRQLWQSFAVLLPVKSVGVMGDERTYEYTIAVRAVESVDAMTADWARLDNDLLGDISNRIINEVKGVNRVVYDITSKPPGTIEWE
jgi:GMP synthase (glutamine-hydrolysing)